MSKNRVTNLHLSDQLAILDTRLDDVEKVLVKQEENLKEHMKRTELLEDAVSPLNKFMYGAYGIIGFIVVLSGAVALATYIK